MCVWLFWGKKSVTSPWSAMTSCIWTRAILVWILWGIFTFGSVLQRALWSAEHLQHSLPSLAFTESHWVPARIHSYAQGHLEDCVSPNEWLSHVIFISISCKARHSDNHVKKAPTLYRLLHMQSKRQFLVSPGFHGLKLLIITNSVLIYINIFTLDYCD